MKKFSRREYLLYVAYLKKYLGYKTEKSKSLSKPQDSSSYYRSFFSRFKKPKS